MKILILSDAQSIHTKRWVSSLSGRGIKVVLFTIKPESDNFYSEIGVKVYTFDLFAYKNHSGILSLFKSISAHLKAVSYLKHVIKQETPDILHAHYATSYGLIAALSSFTPFFLSVWGSDVYEFPYKSKINRLAVKYILRRANYITSTSMAMALQTSKFTTKKIEVIPFGVNTDHFNDTPEFKDGRFVIGTVKTLSHNYGIDLLIRSYKLFSDANPGIDSVLEVVGDGPDREKLEILSAQLGIADKVIFRGYIDNHRLPEVYNSFDLAVFLSRRESFGVSAVEAASCGTPVIASATDGFKEVVEDGVTGVIVPLEDYEAAAKVMGELAHDVQRRGEMGRAARERVISMYDWNRNVSEMISLYLKGVL